MYISRFFGWKSTWATNYVAGSQQPLWLLHGRLWKVRQCWAFAGGYCLPKKCCISHEIFAILYLDKREQDLEDNQETRWSIRAALGLNKQPSTAVERFPKKWQNQTIVMLLDNGKRTTMNRVPPSKLWIYLNVIMMQYIGKELKSACKLSRCCGQAGGSLWNLLSVLHLSSI